MTYGDYYGESNPCWDSDCPLCHPPVLDQKGWVAALETKQPSTWEEALDATLAELRALMIDRQNKYGKANIRDQGLYGVITRAAADKGARIKNSLNGKIVNGNAEIELGDEFKDETFEDACQDAGNYYGVIAIMLLRGWWELPRADGRAE